MVLITFVGEAKDFKKLGEERADVANRQIGNGTGDSRGLLETLNGVSASKAGRLRVATVTTG